MVEIGSVNIGKKRYFLRHFAMFSMVLMCGRWFGKCEYRIDSCSLVNINRDFKKKIGRHYPDFRPKYRDSLRRRNIGGFVFSIFLIVTSL